jgi:5-methylcytosine-specific restriction endonuclease McrA
MERTVLLSSVCDEALEFPLFFLEPVGVKEWGIPLLRGRCECSWDIFMLNERPYACWSLKSEFSSWWTGCRVLVDIDTSLFLEWAERYMVAARVQAPMLRFMNRPGYCTKCGHSLGNIADDVFDRNGIGWGNWLCKQCGIEFDIKVRQQRSTKTRQRRISEKRCLAISEVLYHVYSGQCWFCQQVVPQKYMTVEHIIPESLRRAEYALDYIVELWGHAAAADVEALLPCDLNSFENYVPSCHSCNITKHARILEPSMLTVMLTAARANAPIARANFLAAQNVR